MAGSYIVAGARTPIGKLSGALASASAAELGGWAIKAALERSGVAPEEVEYVLMGQVLMAGQGQVPARQAAQALSELPRTRLSRLRNTCRGIVAQEKIADAPKECCKAIVIWANDSDAAGT